MVCITKPCSHRPRNVAKLKIYLSIFCTTNGLLHASSTHAHLLHALSMHTLSMHHPCTPYPCIIHAHTPACSYGHLHASSTHTHTCLFLWTLPCIIHARTPSACSYGHLHASSTHPHLPVPMDTSMCHPRTHTFCLRHSCTPACIMHAYPLCSLSPSGSDERSYPGSGRWAG